MDSFTEHVSSTPTEPEFRRLCAIATTCLESLSEPSEGEVSELVKDALGRRRIQAEHDVINRAVRAVFFRHRRNDQRAAHPGHATGQFRSRLEAEWAGWLTEAGLSWKYEPCRFRRDELTYVPDFYVPAQGFWLEVKPTYPDYVEIGKATLLAAARQPETVYIVVGRPGCVAQGPTFLSLWCDAAGTLVNDHSWLPESVPLLRGRIDWAIIGDVLRHAGVLPMTLTAPDDRCVCGHTHAQHFDPAGAPVTRYCLAQPCYCPKYQPRGMARAWAPATRVLDAR